MSYILDALKKADAERERGAVPGLHSQPLGQVEDDADDGDGGRRAMPPVVWLGAGVGLCLIAVLSWQLLAAKKDEPVAVASAPVADQGVETAQAVQPVQPTQPADMPPPVQQPQAQQQARQQMPPQTSPQYMPQPIPGAPPTQRLPSPPSGGFNGQREMQPPPPRQGRPAGGEQMAREKPSSATATNTGNSATAASPRASAGERVPTAAELPDDVRQSLPHLVIGGAMYSDTPASRMLIVNSQVFHEGDQPYQGLVLEEIKLKSAVFRYRGYRYAINY